MKGYVLKPNLTFPTVNRLAQPGKPQVATPAPSQGCIKLPKPAGRAAFHRSPIMRREQAGRGGTRPSRL